MLRLSNCTPQKCVYHKTRCTRVKYKRMRHFNTYNLTFEPLKFLNGGIEGVWARGWGGEVEANQTMRHVHYIVPLKSFILNLRRRYFIGFKCDHTRLFSKSFKNLDLYTRVYTCEQGEGGVWRQSGHTGNLFPRSPSPKKRVRFTRSFIVASIHCIPYR